MKTLLAICCLLALSVRAGAIGVDCHVGGAGGPTATTGDCQCSYNAGSGTVNSQICQADGSWGSNTSTTLSACCNLSGGGSCWMTGGLKCPGGSGLTSHNGNPKPLTGSARPAKTTPAKTDATKTPAKADAKKTSAKTDAKAAAN